MFKEYNNIVYNVKKWLTKVDISLKKSKNDETANHKQVLQIYIWHLARHAACRAYATCMTSVCLSVWSVTLL